MNSPPAVSASLGSVLPSSLSTPFPEPLSAVINFRDLTSDAHRRPFLFIVFQDINGNVPFIYRCYENKGYLVSFLRYNLRLCYIYFLYSQT